MKTSTSVNGSVRQWRRYLGYKESGVEGLGTLPDHWKVRRVKYLFQFFDSRRIPLSSEERGTMQKTYPYYGASGIIDYVTDYIFDEPLILLGEDGANLYLRSSPLAFIATGKYWVNNHAHILKPIDGRLNFWESVLQSVVYDPWITGSAQPKLTSDRLGSIHLPFPPECERDAIQVFLDRETAKIDALITKKERLVKLLLEKRTALISHAVTKGIDHTVPVKDSGVAWMGKIPAHWDIIQSRRVFKVRNEPALESDEQLTASQKYGMLPQTEFMELEGRRVVVTIKGVDSLRHVEPNDFVISLRSFQGGIEWCKLRGSVTFHYVVLKPVKTLHPAYFGHLFKSSVFIQALRATTDFIRDGQDLRYSHFILVPLPVVPMDEQARIADYLDQATVRLDSLINVAQQTIDKLREYRIALISAAVTGKIDVREEVV